MSFLAHASEISLQRAYTGEEIISAVREVIEVIKPARIAKMNTDNVAPENALGRFHIIEKGGLQQIGQISQFHIAHIIVCPGYDDDSFDYAWKYNKLLLVHSVWDEIEVVPMNYLPGEEDEAIEAELTRFSKDLRSVLNSRR